MCLGDLKFGILRMNVTDYEQSYASSAFKYYEDSTSSVCLDVMGSTKNIAYYVT